MRTRLVGRGGIVGLALAAVLASVGVGYAAVPSSDGVIHSCYNTSANPAGAMRVIDAEAGVKCAKNEKQLNFNQTGQQGPKGDKGDPGIDGVDGADGIDGAPGATGPAGISTATSTGTSGSQDLAATFVKLRSKVLPEGSWVLLATVNTAFVDVDGIAFASCELRSGAVVLAAVKDGRVVPASGQAFRSLSLHSGAQVPAGGGEVSLWCKSDAEAETVQDSEVTMLKVGGFS